MKKSKKPSPRKGPSHSPSPRLKIWTFTVPKSKSASEYYAEQVKPKLDDLELEWEGTGFRLIGRTYVVWAYKPRLNVRVQVVSGSEYKGNRRLYDQVPRGYSRLSRVLTVEGRKVRFDFDYSPVRRFFRLFGG
jgi:hypothetical protein